MADEKDPDDWSADIQWTGDDTSQQPDRSGVTDAEASK